MGKAYKKKASRKKPTNLGKRKRISRRKMKGGVAFNTPFSTSSLPSSTYIPLNPNVNDNPSWNQIDARLLPAMGGGKRTRKRRGAKKRRESRTHKKHGGSDTTPDTASVTTPDTASVTTPDTASVTTPDTASVTTPDTKPKTASETKPKTASETKPSTLTKFYRATHELVRGKKSAGEICEDVRDNYIRIDGTRLTDYYSDLKEKERKKSFLANTVFYAHTLDDGCNLRELGQLLFKNPFTAWESGQIDVPIYSSVVYLESKTKIRQIIQYIKFTEVLDGYRAYSFPTGLVINKPYEKPNLGRNEYDNKRNLRGYKQSSIFYIKKEDFKEEELTEKDKEVFNELKVDEKEDPYLKVATFDNFPNYYHETWLVRYQLYGFVPTIRQYNENQVNYFKTYK
jgi:hypothetical protein